MGAEYKREFDASNIAKAMIEDVKNGNIPCAFTLYKETVELISELIKNDVKVSFINIADEDCNGYRDEYYISLADFDYSDNYSLYVEPACRSEISGKYLLTDDNVIYAHENTNLEGFFKYNSESQFDKIVILSDEKSDKNTNEHIDVSNDRSEKMCGLINSDIQNVITDFCKNVINKKDIDTVNIDFNTQGVCNSLWISFK